MSAISPRFSLKLRGLTAASATIATVDVAIGGDAVLRWTDAGGVKRSVPVQGDLAVLLRELLTGTGGVASTDRVFNFPVLTANGSGGRADS